MEGWWGQRTMLSLMKCGGLCSSVLKTRILHRELSSLSKIQRVIVFAVVPSLDISSQSSSSWNPELEPESESAPLVWRRLDYEESRLSQSSQGELSFYGETRVVENVGNKDLMFRLKLNCVECILVREHIYDQHECTTFFLLLQLVLLQQAIQSSSLMVYLPRQMEFLALGCQMASERPMM